MRNLAEKEIALKVFGLTKARAFFHLTPDPLTIKQATNNYLGLFPGTPRMQAERTVEHLIDLFIGREISEPVPGYTLRDRSTKHVRLYQLERSSLVGYILDGEGDGGARDYAGLP